MSKYAGVYQSVGLKSANGNSEIYTILTDYNNATIRNYRIEGSGSEQSVTPVDAPLNLCSNKDIKLPMISKDGKELAALDMETQTTVIFSFDAKSGECNKVLDLGKRTGKVDFSFDGRYLVYHTSKVQSEISEDYFKSPLKNWSLQIQILDRKTNGRWFLTRDKKRISYYPVFKKNGQVVFFRTSKEGNESSFAIADPFVSKEKEENTDSEAKTCIFCTATKEILKNVVKEELCGTLEMFQRITEKPTYRSVVQRKCSMCHSHGELNIDFLNVASLKEKKRLNDQT